MRPTRLSLLILFAWLLPAMPVAAAEFYYLLIFGSQSDPKVLKHTHTWATFVKAIGEGCDPADYTLEYHTISWLPRSLNVRVLAPHAEPGVNLDLAATLAFAANECEHVTLWGPFRVRREVYEGSIRQWWRLQSGSVRYRAIDTAMQPGISDCIHAVADIDPDFGRGHYPLIRIGDAASAYVARQMMKRSVFNQRLYDNTWLIPRLGISPGSIRVIRPQEL